MIEPLPCLNCQLHVCPINSESPPCMWIGPMDIASAANRKLHPVKVSTIISVYRPSKDMLNRCLTAILPQVQEIVVCRDQAGVFPSGAMQHPKIRYVSSWRSDIGFGRKMNFAARHSSGKFLHMLNDDCFMDPDAISKLLQTIERDEKIGVVGHLLWRVGRKIILHGGTRRNPANPADPGWGHIDDTASAPSITKPCEMENVCWASVLVRREAYFDVLGMDERLHLSYDDNFINMKLRKNGWKVWYDPRAEAIHDEHSSTKITPAVAEHVRNSRDVFVREWAPFFEWNRDRVPGNFNYLNK